MEEERRRVRTYSEETSRPYYQIRYRLSVTGRELFTSGMEAPPSMDRRDSVFTTASMELDDDEIHARSNRSSSVVVDNSAAHEMNLFSGQVPGTPKSQFRQKNLDTNQTCEIKQQIRRSKSVGTVSDMELNRGAPPISKDNLLDSDLHWDHLKKSYPQLGSEFQGLVTCLNSKNVRKYKVGQRYRNGIVAGIDEEQGKIIVFQSELPTGVLIVLKTQDAARYEKGYAVMDAHGNTLGTVHAIDTMQRLIVLNTGGAA